MTSVTMKQVVMTVNRQPVTASVEPRLSLADFLRERLQLTGTHLGCEHGVCGACTVLDDGVPIRSCLVFAVSLNGSEVRTIEGFDDDDLMRALRAAFSQDHGLQCGFCTPGMLITARDIVLRLPDAGEREIRRELSGNLCRCTGYVGIVNAIQRVLCERKAKPAYSFSRAP
jgi:aerobic carbon-monoxide dehydrogenase small subunit